MFPLLKIAWLLSQYLGSPKVACQAYSSLEVAGIGTERLLICKKTAKLILSTILNMVEPLFQESFVFFLALSIYAYNWVCSGQSQSL